MAAGKPNTDPRLRELVLMALLGALLFAAKMALAGLPNIEPVTLLVMVYSVVFGRRALWAIGLYIGLEAIVWGINVWVINYIYLWPLLWLIARSLRKMEHPLGWAVLAGFYGVFFGAMCAPVYVFTNGWAYALSWWISGIPFDLVHGVGNFAMALVLFAPCRKALEHMKKTVRPL